MTRNYQAYAPDGTIIAGTADRLPGVAHIVGGSYEIGPDGLSFDYEGETRVDWNGQRPRCEGGERLFADALGDVWPESGLVLVEADHAGSTTATGFPEDRLDLDGVPPEHKRAVSPRRETMTATVVWSDDQGVVLLTPVTAPRERLQDGHACLALAIVAEYDDADATMAERLAGQPGYRIVAVLAGRVEPMAWD